MFPWISKNDELNVQVIDKQYIQVMAMIITMIAVKVEAAGYPPPPPAEEEEKEEGGEQVAASRQTAQVPKPPP